MTSEIAKIENSMTFEQMGSRAEMLVKSGFLPTAINTKEKALTIMLTGQELGLGFMESLRSINVIQGKPCMAAQLLLGLCYRTKQVEKACFEKQTATEVIYILKRQGSPEYRAVWTMARATALGLSDRDNWRKQPQTMLQWRAISEACRVTFPDAICGLYTPEEIADGVDLSEDQTTGEVKVIEVTPKAIDNSEVESIKNNLSVEGAAGLPDPNKVYDLGLYELKAPFDKAYPKKNIMQIHETTTPGGKAVGKDFLQMVAEESKDAEEKAIVQKFLEVVNTIK